MYVHLSPHVPRINLLLLFLLSVQSLDGDGTIISDESSGGTEGTPLIYACATMWHETRKEMAQLMKSIFRYCNSFHSV